MEEITPEEEKASVEKLKWELCTQKEELKDREIEYSNLQEQIEELDELDDSVKGIEKNFMPVGQFAMNKLEELSRKLEK